MAQVSVPWPLARRTDERDGFAAALDQDGTNVVVLYGPAGVGKSRLADAFLDAAETSGRLTARVTGSRAAALMPLGALAPVLPHDLDSSATARELFERTRTEFVSLGGDGRLVLLVDDAHLLDTSSSVLLTQLIDAGAVFVVATIRDGEAVPDAVAGWWRSERALRMDLKDLDRSAVAEVLRLALGGEVGADTVRRLHVASGGNPLLLRELVLQALGADRLRDDSGTWRIVGAIPPSQRLSDLFAARLTPLSDGARDVLEQLALCAPLGPAELTGEHTPHDLEALERAGLIRVLLDDHRQQVTLAHPLYGEALRAGVPALRRRAILLGAADRVEALGARRREDPPPHRHWRLDAGGSPGPELLLQAATVARYAHDFAEVERLASVLMDAEPSAEAAVLLGEAHYELGRFDEAEAVLAAPVPPGTPVPLLVQRATLRTKNLQWGLCDAAGAMAAVDAALAVVGAEQGDDLVAERGSVLLFSGHPQDALDIFDTIDGGDRPDPRAHRHRAEHGARRSRADRGGGGRGRRGVRRAQRARRADRPGPPRDPHRQPDLRPGGGRPPRRGRRAGGARVRGGGVRRGADRPDLVRGHPRQVGGSARAHGRVLPLVPGGGIDGPAARVPRPPERGAGRQAVADAVLGRASAAACIAEYEGLPEFPFFGHDHLIGIAGRRGRTASPPGPGSSCWRRRTPRSPAAASGRPPGCWHDAARLGATGVGPRLRDAAARSDSPVVAARAAHVTALEADDGDGLVAAADAFESFGAALLAAEAASAASDAFRRRRRPSPRRRPRQPVEAADGALPGRADARAGPGRCRRAAEQPGAGDRRRSPDRASAARRSPTACTSRSAPSTTTSRRPTPSSASTSATSSPPPWAMPEPPDRRDLGAAHARLSSRCSCALTCGSR